MSKKNQSESQELLGPELLLEQLQVVLRSDKLEERERLHLTRDLSALTKRLHAGEYKVRDFQGSTFDIEGRTKEFFSYLQSYKRSAETLSAILNLLNLSETQMVIDLFPGWAPKVEIALLYSGYSGEVILIDQNESSLAALVACIHVFHPSFSISSRVVSLPSPEAPSAQLVIANHVIDDLLISFLQAKGLMKTHHSYKEEDDPTLLWAWITDTLRSNLKLFEEAIEYSVTVLLGCLETHSSLVITQYQSYFERLYKLDTCTKLSTEIMQKVVCVLTENHDFYSRADEVEKALRNTHGYFSHAECSLLTR